MAAKMMVLLSMLLGAPSWATVLAVTPEQTDKDSYVVTGTLLELDLTKASGKINTYVETWAVSAVTTRDLFRGLWVGNRFTAPINDQAKVIKVMETTIRYLPSTEKKAAPPVLCCFTVARG